MGRLNRLSHTDYESSDRDRGERILPYSGDRPASFWERLLRFAGTILGKVLIGIVAAAPVGGLFWETIGRKGAPQPVVLAPAAPAAAPIRSQPAVKHPASQSRPHTAAKRSSKKAAHHKKHHTKKTKRH